MSYERGVCYQLASMVVTVMPNRRLLIDTKLPPMWLAPRQAVTRPTIRRTHGATSVTVTNAKGQVVAQLLSH